MKSAHGTPQSSPSSPGPDFGAFVISLDFELHWGVRDHHRPDGSYAPNLLGARKAVPLMLELFERHRMAATWATVGFLFARSRDQRERFRPAVLPGYRDGALDPYSEQTGESEADDPLHYAASLIEAIRTTPGQEIATHTYSHYYCLEPGQTRAAFEADLRSAVAIALQWGVPIRSIVFPRNQVNPEYRTVLRDAGVLCYRGPGPGWVYRARPRSGEGIALRAARWLDSYAGLPHLPLGSWREVLQPDGLSDVRAQLFLRPCSHAGLDRLQFARVRRAIEQAATRKEIFHLWWHPHNFGVRTGRNTEFLQAVCRTVNQFRDSHGLRSMSMFETAQTARTLQLQACAA